MAFYSSETVILKDQFNFFPAVSVSCNVTLTEKYFSIEQINNSKPESDKISLNDVIGCHILRGKCNKLRDNASDISAYFCIYAYPLKTSGGILSKQVRRERRALTFQTKRFETQDENLQYVNKWRRAILSLLKGISCMENGEVCIPDTVPPVPKFLILINPKSGPGKAHQIFQERVVPLLFESDVQYDLLVTDRANCARDYVKQEDLTQWNGIVVVSGDGLLFEVYNGLMARSDWQEAVKIPVGVIPGGSGNGLARAISHTTGEPYDVTAVVPSVMNIIRGRIVPMDLVRVQTPNEFYFSFLSVGWGLMADIDIESEKLRAIGEARFTVWGIIRALGLRKYKGRLSYLPVRDYDPKSQVRIFTEPKPKRSKTLDCTLTVSDNSAFTEEDGDHSIFRSKSFGARDPDIIQDEDRAVRLLKYSFSNEKVNNSFSDMTDFQEQLLLDETPRDVPHCTVTSDVKCPQPAKSAPFCPPLSSPVPDDWVTINDEFVLVYVCHQTHLSSDVLFAPDARPDDGIMWLIVIRADVSRAQVIYFLSSLQTGEHVNIPYVDYIPIHAFRLEPSTSDGFLTVDGEVIPCCTIQAEVLPSIARIMTR
ncbi:sphingosine kinase 1-like [Uloborus diversus]|uniref:sphingosine kinase 1-like n=1 Tax=Uloborus diversus TaxID=327109 RepID=UPI00240A72C3|nr:sphingosine kinase 1-like [Uloborus diversus]